MGGEATYVSKAQCGVCDAFYGEFATHDWSKTWDHSTAAGHSHSCMTAVCEAISGSEPHKPNIPAATETEDQVCSLCGYVIAKAGGASDPADPVVPTDPVDSTEPSNPADPTDPVAPSDPTEPGKSADPTQPTQKDDSVDQPKTEFLGLGYVIIAVIAAGVVVAVVLLVMKKKDNLNAKSVTIF